MKIYLLPRRKSNQVITNLEEDKWTTLKKMKQMKMILVPDKKKHVLLSNKNNSKE